ncbi:MAG: cell division topological specificity factor MinE [Campylobacteraceae bacterium]|jgi:cell division topological specificity factor|nr:cell division topological specificity factor MinE [Campylobacteraceae bacterium]
MSLIDIFFGKRQASAGVAKDRLTIMLATERGSNALPHMDEMKKEILEVIKKYTKVRDVKIKSENNQNIETLELEIVLDR